MSKTNSSEGFRQKLKQIFGVKKGHVITSSVYEGPKPDELIFHQELLQVGLTLISYVLPFNALFLAKLQNTRPLIYILLNRNSAYCVPLRSSKGFDKCKTGGPKWLCIPRP